MTTVKTKQEVRKEQAIKSNELFSISLISKTFIVLNNTFFVLNINTDMSFFSIVINLPESKYTFI